GVDRGSAPDTVDFTLPAGLANGSYALTVTANGITSNSITFTTYPNMTSDVTPTAICSGHTFSYTPTYDRSCVSDTWTRAAVAGISNAAITTPQTSNPNEILYNTTSSPIAVTYAYSMTHNGYSTTQNVVVTVNPSPTVTTSATSTSLCLGESTTITASGAVTYAWDPGTSTGSSVVFTPTSTTTYTVTGTNIYGCTDQATRKVYVNSNPTVVTSVVDEELCAGSNQSTTISVGANQTINSIQTTMAGGNGNQGNAFDIHAYNSITITDFKMNITSGDSAEVWYNPGGYGNADITSNTGWTRLGARVAITPAGSGFLTTIPTTANLTIPAGSTYGIIVICNGSNNYTNGTLVGSIEASNLDLYITEGHGGSGFGTTFNFLNSPRIFNGTVEYRTNLTDYLWTPSSTLSSATVSNPTATPTSTTNYTVTVTDGNGCTGTSVAKVYVYTKPVITGTTATPSSICAGASSQLNVTHGTSTTTQNLFTTLDGGNSFSGNVFDVHALNSINITNVRMHILSGDSAQVWYKAGGYGGANLSSNIGWTKLGNTVAVTPQGAGALTLISTTANLFISAGQTYGIAVVSNGSV
ncbi:MAG TPA: hypothetical protein PLP14_09690, partial [Chitinophagaceae bacterium]|nr:hypothetical protein [Chitinophagaceae bacterium]